MNTPIADFVRGYEKENRTRFHMPGHKGTAVLGCEAYDITEISGADDLYHPEGIIAESERNATEIFGTKSTIYSTEGASQCIRAMLYLAMSEKAGRGRKKVIATRNAHKSFLYAVALLDLDVIWMLPKEETTSICSCLITPASLEAQLLDMEDTPVAVYVTSPDYLGNMLDIKGLAEVCHKHHTILAVDNAHGAYLRFMKPSLHPIDLGADICCDSAHKTLPVLTGGAYLHVGQSAPDYFVEQGKRAMSIFGSTSPSYLILASLDLCNAYLSEDYRGRLEKAIAKVSELRHMLTEAGWETEGVEGLKLTVRVPKGRTGYELSERLRSYNIECEYADPEYVVCMMTPENTELDFERLLQAFGTNDMPYETRMAQVHCVGKQEMTIREAMFGKIETVEIEQAKGRICAVPSVSCPPAIPIVVSGEKIEEQAIEAFRYYKMKTVDVVKE